MLKTTVAFAFGILFGAALFSTGAAVAQTNASTSAETNVLQLRVYTIDRGRLDDFTNAWRAGVYPLHQKFGVQIPFAATIPSTNQFVWLVAYRGPLTWQQKEDEYYSSDERKHLSPDPQQWIARGEQLMLMPVIAPK